MRKATVSGLVHRIERRVGATSLALAAGVSRALARRWADAEDDAQIGVADAAGLALEDRLVLAEYIAGPSHFVAEVPSGSVSPLSDVQLAADAQRETGEALTRHLAAIADGTITRGEATEVRREIREAIRALVTLDRSLDQAMREGVVATRLRAVESAS